MPIGFPAKSIKVLPLGGIPPTPSLATVGQGFLDPLSPSHLWVGTQEFHARTAPVIASATAYAAARYKNVHNSDYPVQGNVGDYYFDRQALYWRELTLEATGFLGTMISERWIHLHFNEIDDFQSSSYVWLGRCDDMAAAAERLEALGTGQDNSINYLFYHQADDEVQVVDDDAFTAAIDPFYTFGYAEFVHGAAMP